MVGRKIERPTLPRRKTEPTDEDPILTIRDLQVKMPGELVKGINLNVRRGEILGIGGLAGHGKLGIANGVMGLYPATGKVRKDDKPVNLDSSKSALRAAWLLSLRTVGVLVYY